MKMENIIKSEKKAIVKKVNCKEGDSLEVDQIILEFEWNIYAAVAELVDAQRWGRCRKYPVEVRVFSAAPESYWIFVVDM